MYLFLQKILFRTFIKKIKKLRTGHGRIGTLSDIRGLYLYVALDNAKGAVGLDSNPVNVVIPGKIVGDVYT